MFKRNLVALATLGALVTGCYSGSDGEERGLVISAADLDALAPGEPLVVDLSAPDALVRFDLGDGPIDVARVIIVRPDGAQISLRDLVALYGEALDIDLIEAQGFTLTSHDLSGLAPISAFLGTLMPSQSDALATLPRIDGIRLDERALPRTIVGDLGVLEGDAASGAQAFVDGLRPAFRLDAGQELEVVRVDEDELGQVHVRMQQLIDDLPVVGGDLIVHADIASGSIHALTSRLAPRVGADEGDLLDGDAAIEAALRDLEGAGFEVVDAVDLVYVVVGGAPVLAFTAQVAYEGEDGPELDQVFADARGGALVARHPKIHRAKNRKVYTANNGGSLPGTLKISEGGSSGDAALQAAYDNSGLTYDFYKAKFNRDSYNGSGAQLKSTAHYGNNYNNAFWNGSQMVYGDGDGYYFTSLSLSPDIAVHELTHAVTEYSANLVYQDESGALNEAFSDIMASAAQAWKAGGVSSATWKLAEDVWTPSDPNDAMRYMDDPTADGQSYDYYPTRYTGNQDNGGVHLNSGIANLAFKLAVTGGTHPRGKTNVNVPALGMAKVEQIFYRALTTYLTSYADFEDARNATAQAATDLYGASAASAIHAAWDAVGVPGTQNQPPPDNNDPPPPDDNQDQCGGVPYAGSLSGKGAVQYQPGGTYYYSSKSGTHAGCLSGPGSADFDLYLLKWNGSGWTQVAKSEGETSAESISYNGGAGYYVWKVSSWSGSGGYSLGLTTP
ncbi:MAG: M4 family metallopeptidase [Myxococcales bacterium]|nr:M4 family metallopeptidase [Myxococcales bacterium]